jgi:hypothetical protein
MHGEVAPASRTRRRDVSDVRIIARKLGRTIYEVAGGGSAGGHRLCGDKLRKTVVENEAGNSAENPASKPPLFASLHIPRELGANDPTKGAAEALTLSAAVPEGWCIPTTMPDRWTSRPRAKNTDPERFAYL